MVGAVGRGGLWHENSGGNDQIRGFRLGFGWVRFVGCVGS